MSFRLLLYGFLITLVNVYTKLRFDQRKVLLFYLSYMNYVVLIHVCSSIRKQGFSILVNVTAKILFSHV